MKRLLIPALLLAGLALEPAAANADGSGFEWRSGGRSDIWYRHSGDRDWRRAPGSALDVGDGWVIGTDRRHGGYSIYRWDGHRWHRMPGAGVKIGGSYHNPWVVNDRGERFSWNGYGWREEFNFSRGDNRGRNDRNDWDRGFGNNGRDRGRDDNDWNRGRGNDRGRDDNDRNRGRDDSRGRDDGDWRRGGGNR